MTATIPALLQPLKDRLAGFENLCPEYLRQSIRHVQRNCDIECNVHEDDAAWDACKQPDRYDGDRMAHALSKSAKLIAAIEAVEKEVAWWMHQFTTSNSQDVAMRAAAYKIRAALTQALGGDTA